MVALGAREAARTNSVVRPLRAGRRPVYLIPHIASIADGAPQWGHSSRDKYLRNFYRGEDFIASATFTMAARYAGLPFSLYGGPRTVPEVRRMLHASEHGKGIHTLWSKVATDGLTTDNGGWVEVYREKNSPEAIPTQLNHLDSLRCHRTGDWENPIEYEDSAGKLHKMAWYQVMEFTDFPQPDEDKYGLGFCAVSRILRAAQVLRDISIYEHEKISGQFNKRITVVNGLGPRQVKDVLEEQRVEARAQGFLRYIQPAIMSSVDPRAPLAKIDIDLAMLPESWDLETFMRWMVVKVGMAYGEDPQEFAPLPGNNLGSSQQSEILHLKGKSKGPNLWMKSWEHQLPYQGVIPGNVTFRFGEQDTMVSVDQQRSRLMRAQELAILVKAGIIHPAVAAQMLADEGALDNRYLEIMGYPDVITDVQIEDTGPLAVGGTHNPAKLMVPSAAQPERTGGGMASSTSSDGGVR